MKIHVLRTPYSFDFHLFHSSKILFKYAANKLLELLKENPNNFGDKILYFKEGFDLDIIEAIHEFISMNDCKSAIDTFNQYLAAKGTFNEFSFSQKEINTKDCV